MTQTSSPRGRAAPATSTATRGVIVVIFAFFVGFMLLWKGGGGASEGTPDNDLPGTTEVATDETTETTPPPPATAVPPAELKVVVANGTSTKGLAGSTADRLKAAGYAGATATDATVQATNTQVFFVEGAEGDAQAVAAALGVDIARVAPIGSPPPVDPLGENRVVVLLGPDAPTGAPPAPTTTAAT